MWKVAVVLLAITGLWPAIAAAQPADAKSPVIIVIGTGTASQPPDYGTLSYTVRGEGKTEVEALQALEISRAKIEGALNGLAEAKRVDITSSDLGVSAARGPDCKPDDSGEIPAALSNGPCAIVGYIAVLKSKVEVAPAAKVGNAISLAAQQSGIDPTFGEWDVDDMAALRDAAVKDAMAKARRKAELMAEASGMKLGPIVRIEDAAARGLDQIEDELNFAPGYLAARSPAAQIRPQVLVDLKPTPVETTQTYALTFALAP